MLRDAEHRAALFASVLDSMGESVLVVDKDGKEVYGNRELRRFRGHEPRLGEGVDTWRSPEHMKIFDRDGAELEPADWPVARALRGDFKTNFEIRVQGMRHTDDEVTLAISTRSLVSADGKVEGAVIVTRDITSVRSTEDQLRQSQKLETIGQLTGGIAHDFNNMLAAIFSSVEVLKKGIGENPRLEMALDLIDRAAHRGAELTRHLLAFARKQTLKPTTVNVAELIDETMMLARPALGATIDIEAEFPDAPMFAHVDSAQLASALLNLCINARDAMNGGGKVLLKVEPHTVERPHEPLFAGEYVRISVADTGSGMSEDVVKRAIEPFFTTKGPGRGSGLGLSMVFGFARQSGGDLEIESELGVGTTMTLVLPRSEPKAVSEPVGAAPYGHGKLRILLVDDHELVRDALALQLQQEGFEVATATDGQHALELVAAGLQFEVLLTDMVMPRGMNGAELATEVQKRRPAVRTILSTGYAEQDIALQGAVLLRKPYTTAQLFAALRAIAPRP